MSDSLVWPVDASLLPVLPEGDVVARQRLQAAIDTAVMVLWRLTGMHYGMQRLVARPCPRVQDTVNDYGLLGSGHVTPVLSGGTWFNVGCAGGCQSDGPGSVHLPGPVYLVESVGVGSGDEVIHPSSYYVEGDRLIRAHGEAWPTQDLQRPLGEPGTWRVTYLRGVGAPAGAGAIVASLAGELYKAVVDPGKCRLPKGWQTVQRQGITVQRMDASELLNAGRTGLPDVDLWVKALNPKGIMRPATVGSVDTLGGR